MTNHFNNQNQLQIELFIAAKAGEVARMYSLIQKGANPYMLDENNLNPFMYAIRVKSAEMCTSLSVLETLVADFYFE